MAFLELFGSAAAAQAAQTAVETAERESLKKGKSAEQQRAIDYLFNAKRGCLNFLSINPFTTQEYIDYVNRICSSTNFYAKALQKLGLDESQVQEIQPIMLTSFVYDDDCRVRVDNNVALSSQYSIAWIFFSDTQMYTYKYIFDTTSDNTWEITNDFFYSDITCFTTIQANKEKIRVIPGKGCLHKEDIIKNHYVVDTLEIIVPGTSYRISLTNSTTVEQSIQAAKAMLREKKYMK